MVTDETGRPRDEGGSDYGSDISRDLGDGPPGWSSSRSSGRPARSAFGSPT
jgi:hypothetical protein